jgi:RNA recognition motif-containing protein
LFLLLNNFSRIIRLLSFFHHHTRSAISVNEAELRAHFEHCGPIHTCVVKHSPRPKPSSPAAASSEQQQGPRVFGFVNFLTREARDAALKLHQVLKVHGQVLIIIVTHSSIFSSLIISDQLNTLFGIWSDLSLFFFFSGGSHLHLGQQGADFSRIASKSAHARALGRVCAVSHGAI